MSVIKATVTILMFIIVFVSNSANGQNEPTFYYNNRRAEWSSTSSSRDSMFPKTHIPKDVPPEEISTKNRNTDDTTPNTIPSVADDSSDADGFGISYRFGSDDVERRKEKFAISAECIPDNAIVRLEPRNPSNDSSISYFPLCTRVKRCSGCCQPHLVCEPIEVNWITLTVSVKKNIGKPELQTVGKEPVVVEQHTKCRCGCRIKPEDCNPNQYHENCQCFCKKDDRVKCEAESNKGKVWDNNTCKCKCEKTRKCSSGLEFDEDVCNCTPVRDRKHYIVTAVPDFDWN